MGAEGAPQEPVNDPAKAEDMARASDELRSKAAASRAEIGETVQFYDITAEGQEEVAAFEFEEKKRVEAMKDEELLQAFRENDTEREEVRQSEETGPTIRVGNIPKINLLHSTHVILQDEIKKRNL